jgi:hypothetical protein
MDNITAVHHLISSVPLKIRDEIHMLREVHRQLDAQSNDPTERWTHGLYARLIARREKMLSVLTAEMV